MSRFYATIQGSRGEASRQGHGHITGHVRGWRAGVRVSGHAEGDADVFDIYLTGGSGGHTPDVFLGTYSEAEGWKPREV